MYELHTCAALILLYCFNCEIMLKFKGGWHCHQGEKLIRTMERFQRQYQKELDKFSKGIDLN